jgi:hypothetical protein
MKSGKDIQGLQKSKQGLLKSLSVFERSISELIWGTEIPLLTCSDVPWIVLEF